MNKIREIKITGGTITHDQNVPTFFSIFCQNKRQNTANAINIVVDIALIKSSIIGKT